MQAAAARKPTNLLLLPFCAATWCFGVSALVMAAAYSNWNKRSQVFLFFKKVCFLSRILASIWQGKKVPALNACEILAFVFSFLGSGCVQDSEHISFSLFSRFSSFNLGV